MNLTVTSNSMYAQRGILRFIKHEFTCALGESGITTNKQEGDGATPVGTFALRKIYYRPDRWQTLDSTLPIEQITPHSGWSDDPKDKRYNRYIQTPHPFRHENLWRDDAIYNILIVLGYNDSPAISGKGSAIFFHLAHPNYSPTKGCIAISEKDMRYLLPHLKNDTKLTIQPI